MNRFPSRVNLPLLLRVVLFLALVFFLWSWMFSSSGERDESETVISSSIKKRVPFELFVMSQCPDAAFCEDFYRRIIQGPLASILNVTMNFIASITEGPNGEPVFRCAHGPGECEGNLAQICARFLSPDRWFDFVLCMSNDPWGIPENAGRCAKVAGIDSAAHEACRTGPLGRQLFLESATRTRALLVKRSCTLFLNNQFYCLRDGGIWQPKCVSSSLTTLARDICQIAGATMPASSLPPICRDADALTAAFSTLKQ